MTKRVLLTQGYAMLVTEEQAAYLAAEFTGLCALVLRRHGRVTQVYAYGRRAGKKEPIHRALMAKILGRPLRRGEEVDHVQHRESRGVVDNRPSNIRLATKCTNQRNARKHADSRSRFKGVTWSRQSRKWRAQICVDGRRICIGQYASEREAAVAYDVSARAHFGDFAATNRRLGLLA